MHSRADNIMYYAIALNLDKLTKYLENFISIILTCTLMFHSLQFSLYYNAMQISTNKMRKYEKEHMKFHARKFHISLKTC